MVVVLPAPFGPRKATISPGSRVRSIPRTAWTGPKSLVTPDELDGGHGPGGGAGRSREAGLCHGSRLAAAGAASPHTAITTWP